MRSLKNVDWVGILLFMPSAVCLLAPFTMAGIVFDLNSTEAIVLLVVGIVGLVLLGVHQRWFAGKKPHVQGQPLLTMGYRLRLLRSLCVWRLRQHDLLLPRRLLVRSSGVRRGLDRSCPSTRDIQPPAFGHPLRFGYAENRTPRLAYVCRMAASISIHWLALVSRCTHPDSDSDHHQHRRWARGRYRIACSAADNTQDYQSSRQRTLHGNGMALQVGWHVPWHRHRHGRLHSADGQSFKPTQCAQDDGRNLSSRADRRHG